MKAFRVRTGMVMYSSRSIIIALLVANLAACGFYLRGSSSLPPQLVSMQVLAENLDSSQKTALNQQLIQAGASLKDNLAGDTVRLTVTIKVLPERKLADTAGSGKTIIRVFRQLSYSLTTGTGALLQDHKSILRQQDIELDSNNLAGLEYEKESAGVLLDEALIGQLIFQLKHFQN
jgi:outer membrane lipopolysaccharide assembly protein LptE/RlpB